MSTCPPTLLVRSGRDFFRVGQGAGDLHLILNDGVIFKGAENAQQRITWRQRRERGYGDVDLEEKCKKRRRGIKGQAICAHRQACALSVWVGFLSTAVIITIQQCCSNISSSLLLTDLNRFNFVV